MRGIDMYKTIVATAGIFEFANNECFCVKDQIHTTVYRMCANPSCNCIFEVASTNERNKYHSLSCQRAMSQRFNRARSKQTETE